MLDRSLNGEMVLLARNRRRLTQKELATAAGVPQTAVSRVENGIHVELSIEQVKAIARALRFPAAFLYEQEPLYRQPVSLHPAAFRKRQSVSAKDEAATVALGNHYVLQLRRLLEGVELDSEFETLQFEIVKDGTGPAEHARAVVNASEAARAVRASWQLGDGPIADLTRYVEASGVIVVHADFGAADIDGFTLRPVGLKPVILLNANRQPDRMRFSLAHEYGHVVLHPFPLADMETEANEFAAELLTPRNGILPDLRNNRLSIPYLAKLKLKWRVSIASLIYRAKAVGLIDADAMKRLYIEFSPYRTREPVEFDIPTEHTKLAKDLVRVHLDELGFSIIDLANATATLPEEFAQMHGLAGTGAQNSGRPKLRLVSSVTD